MAKTLSAPKRAFGKLVSAVTIAAALCASSASQAGVLNFETTVDNPLVFSGDVLTIGEYRLEGAGTAGFVGMVGNTDSCAGIQCPVNASGNYYSAFDDGYFFLGMSDFSKFTLKSLDASFIGAGLASYPAVSALLYVAGYDAKGFVADIYLDLKGPVGANFEFAHFDLGSFGNFAFTDLLFASFACDAAGNCNRNTNQANFAIDNIATAAPVPEPGTFALLGLGLLGLVARARRRAV